MKLLHLSLLSLLAFHSASLLASVPCDENNDPCPQGYASVDQTWEEAMHAFLLYPLGAPQDEITETLSPTHEKRTHTDSESSAIFYHLLHLRSMENHKEICDIFEIYFNHPRINADHFLYKAYAQSALDLENYEFALTLIQKYVKYIGIKDTDSLEILAKAYTFSGNLHEASYYWYQYFEAVDPDTVTFGDYINAAFTSYGCDRIKQSEKYLKLALKRNDSIQNFVDQDSLRSITDIFSQSKNHDMAVYFWNILINEKPDTLSADDYASAALDFDLCGKYEEARICLERYHTLLPESEHYILSIFHLGKLYAEDGQTEKALFHFNRILNTPKKNKAELRGAVPTWFSLAATTYLMQGDEKSAQGFIDLHNTYQTYAKKAQQNLLCLQHFEQPARAKKRSNTRQNTVQKLHQHIKEIEQDRCTDLIQKIQYIDFSTCCDGFSQESKRQKLLKDLKHAAAELQQLQHTVPDHGATQGTQRPTILTIQEQINILERDYDALNKAHGEALKAHKKSRVRAFLATLDTNSDLSAFTPTQPTSLRGLYGYEKTVRSTPTQTTTTTTTTTKDTPQEEGSLPQVSFFQLKSIEKDLITLKRIPGMAAKYDAFLSEIKQNPTELIFSSGKAKTLVGEKGIYSRRFDKANRLVYRVTKQNDGSFHVVILSVLGHYNDLEAKMEKSRQEKKPQKKANKTKKKNTKVKSKNKKK